MVANCSSVMNKARQPPPGVMPKGRPPSASSLDAISPVQVVDKSQHAVGLETLIHISSAALFELFQQDYVKHHLAPLVFFMLACLDNFSCSRLMPEGCSSELSLTSRMSVRNKGNIAGWEH